MEFNRNNYKDIYYDDDDDSSANHLGPRHSSRNTGITSGRGDQSCPNGGINCFELIHGDPVTGRIDFISHHPVDNCPQCDAEDVLIQPENVCTKCLMNEPSGYELGDFDNPNVDDLDAF